MPRSLSRHLVRLLPLLRLRTQSLNEHAWVVQTRDGAELGVDRLELGSWLVQAPGRRRTVKQLGTKQMRTHLITDRAAARELAGRFQNRMGHFLGNQYIAWILERMEINCVLDVGANSGQFARRIRRGGYRGRIVSFEPLARYAEPLRAAAAADADWIFHDCALGNEDGSMEINATSGTVSSLLKPSEFGMEWSDRLRDVHQETIRIRRLESLYDEVTAGLDAPRVFLKMDTQGFDLQAFQGAGARVADILGLQSEVSLVPIYDGMPRLPEQLEAYEAAGFAVSGIYPVSRHGSTLRLIECDLVMVRPEAVPPR